MEEETKSKKYVTPTVCCADLPIEQVEMVSMAAAGVGAAVAVKKATSIHPLDSGCKKKEVA